MQCAAIIVVTAFKNKPPVVPENGNGHVSVIFIFKASILIHSILLEYKIINWISVYYDYNLQKYKIK